MSDVLGGPSDDLGPGVATSDALGAEADNRAAGDTNLQNSLDAETSARVVGDTTVVANTRTGDYTLALSDAGKVVEMNAATSKTVTVPPNSSIGFPVGVVVKLSRYGAGALVVAPGVGVTINSPGGLLSVSAQYASASLRKRATNEWMLTGDLV